MTEDTQNLRHPPAAPPAHPPHTSPAGAVPFFAVMIIAAIVAFMMAIYFHEIQTTAKTTSSHIERGGDDG